MVENTTNQNNQEINTPDKNNNQILNVFKDEFASAQIPVYINSLKRDVIFGEITVVQQKELSKTMIQNESRKDIVYDAQCALINSVCKESGFDIYNLTEFDRIRILLEIYATNYFHETITYKCPECGCENSYNLNFDGIVQKLNAFDLEDIKFTSEDRQRVYNFTLNYPSVRQVSNFYKNYSKKYKNTTKREQEMLDELGSVEYINLFINKIQIINKANPNNPKEANLKLMTYDDIETLISYFPQNIMFDEEKGVLKYITSQFIDKINNLFQYEKCAHCGYETKEGMGSLVDFF